MSKDNNVITISYGRQLLDVDNHEHKRHVQIAKELTSLAMVVFTSRRAGELPVVTSEPGLTVHPTNSRLKILMLFDAYRVAGKIIKHTNPKPIVTTQDPAAAGLVGLLLKWRYGVQLVVQEHCDVMSTPHWRNESLKNWLQYWVSIFVLRRADVVRVVAGRSVGALRQLGVTAPITQLPVSVAAERFVAAQSSRPHNRDTFEYVTLARFVKQKNFPLLIRAFAAAHKVVPALRLKIVGTGPEESTILATIAEQFPSATHSVVPITIEGWTDDVATLLREADAYVLSSNYEGWGRVLIEAVVARLPIVTTDVGCVGEVIVPGQHALVVPLDDEQALTKALVKLARDTECYASIVDNQSALTQRGVVGTQLEQYGTNWRETLTPTVSE